MKKDFLWRVEKACWTAWPSAEDKMISGWLCRTSGGETRRTNSANATLESCSIRDVVEPAAKFYEGRDQPLLFRTLSFMPDIERELAALGFQPEGETCTLQADLTNSVTLPVAEIESHSSPTESWITDKLRLTPMDPAQEKAYRAMLTRIDVPASFVRFSERGKGVSVAYGAIVDGILIIESVVTAPAYRGRGIAEQTVGALMAWACDRGAAISCLQVVADNAAGHALYRKLGYGAELYRYRYWRAPEQVIKT